MLKKLAKKAATHLLSTLLGTSKNLLRGHLLHLRASLCTSKAAFLGATSAPLATVFRSPLKAQLFVFRLGSRVVPPSGMQVASAKWGIQTAPLSAHVRDCPYLDNLLASCLAGKAGNSLFASVQSPFLGLLGKRAWLTVLSAVFMASALAVCGMAHAATPSSSSNAPEVSKASVDAAPIEKMSEQISEQIRKDEGKKEVSAEPKKEEAKIGEATKEAQKVTPIPFKQDGSAIKGSLEGGAIGVLLVSLVAIGLVWWARKKLNLQGSSVNQGKFLRILESQRIGPRAVLSVIEFEGGRYLIAQSEQGITCLLPAQAAKVTAALQEAS